MTITRRRLMLSALPALALASTADAAPTGTTPPIAKRLIVFGDSYSDLDWATYRMWSERLEARGDAGAVVSFAKAGATALNYSASPPARMTFRSQVDLFLANPGWTNKDVIVVYLGYNDVNRYDQAQWLNLEAAKAEYRTQLERLIAAGGTLGNRRIVLTTIHDWGRTPGGLPIHRTRSKEWNRFVRSLVTGRSGVLVGELWRRFEDVHLRPASYRLVNVTDPNPTRAGIDYLYADTYHFGARGQNLIAVEFRAILQLVRASRRR
jgi:phospholipase/lecithinase/hemolysin